MSAEWMASAAQRRHRFLNENLEQMWKVPP